MPSVLVVPVAHVALVKYHAVFLEMLRLKPALQLVAKLPVLLAK